MQERQTVEWKESWKNKYLKWICGYANAYGGTLVIGKNENGIVTGISNPRKLLKRLSKKITKTTGITANISLLRTGDLEYLEIAVEKYPVLLSYRGKYYYRSDSIMRTIDGWELEKALSRNQCMYWDGIPTETILDRVLFLQIH
ncbi:MAG: ATP-binding protein [Clostridiales bacterium]|nr:ATP-binding protein [Clostridiales bacterium]